MSTAFAIALGRTLIDEAFNVAAAACDWWDAILADAAERTR